MQNPENETVSLAPPSFAVGTVFGKTWSVYRRAPLLFLALCGLAALPRLLAAPFFGYSYAADFILRSVGDIAHYMLCLGGTAFAAHRILTGLRVTLGGAVRNSVRHLFFLLAVLAIERAYDYGLWEFLIIDRKALFEGNKLLELGLFIIIFYFLAIFPLRFCVIVPIGILENVGLIGSFVRSVRLTYGHVGKLFGLTAIKYALITLLPIELLKFLFADKSIEHIVYYAIGPFPEAFFCIMLTVIYRELKAVKEGVSMDELTQVF